MSVTRKSCSLQLAEYKACMRNRFSYRLYRPRVSRVSEGGASGNPPYRRVTGYRHRGVAEWETLSVIVPGWIGAVIWRQTRRRVRHFGLHGRLAARSEKKCPYKGVQAGRALK